jgi:hypothetical protein
VPRIIAVLMFFPSLKAGVTAALFELPIIPIMVIIIVI